MNYPLQLKLEVDEFLESTDKSKWSVAQHAWLEFYYKIGSLPDHIILSTKDYHTVMSGIFNGLGDDFFTLKCVDIVQSQSVDDGKPFCFNYKAFIK